MVEEYFSGPTISSMATSETLNVIRPYGYSVSKCGYCKGSRSHLLQTPEPIPVLQTSNHASSSPTPTSKSSKMTSKSYSVLADSVSPALYEDLINKGWRRSGVHLYKPQNFSSCCPTLTTRLLTREFKPTKSQRKVLKKMKNILRPSLREKETTATALPMMIRSTLASKKQKKLHRQKQKLRNTKAVFAPSNSDDSDHPELETSKTSSSYSSSLVEQIEENNILRKLEEATTKAIEKHLSCSLPNYSNENFKQQRQIGKFKTSYRILASSKQERRQLRIRIASRICAQISGYYRISRDQLAQQVVQLMKEDDVLSILHSTNSQSKRAIPSINCSCFSFASLEAHLPSGQIICTIEGKSHEQRTEIKRRVDTEEDNTIASDTEMKDSKEKGSHSFKHSTGADSGKLSRWYKKTTGKDIHIESNQYCITIDTLPAHRSALDPDVHRLYIHYQHAVHNDPNPFSDNPNDVNINTDDSNSDEDEEELKLDSDDPSELDWGHAPTYFTDKISSMLTPYIQSLQSKESRRAVLSNYYSFYQFLVEAPFPLQDVSTTRHNYPKSDDNVTQQHPHHSWFKENWNLPCGLYHQHYRLGGELLIAVGVIDVLPTGLSSVYLFYLPSFSQELVALGKYAILKEIEFARDVLKVPYYYLGYYIESCQKMRYKAEYKPTQMLCPKYHDWVDATIAIEKLQRTPRHVCPLIEATPKTEEKSKNANEIRNQKATSLDINGSLRNLQMDIGAGMNVTIDMLQSSGVEVVKPILKEFILEFSPELCQQCILKLT